MDTGEELAKIKTEGQTSTFAGFTVGYHNDVFMCSNLDKILFRFTTSPLGGEELEDTPLPVALASFEGRPLKDAIRLNWTTTSEWDNLGFNVYRSRSLGGPFHQVNAAPIPAQAQAGAYEWVDEVDAPADTYYYYLENVSLSGEKSDSHTIRVSFTKSDSPKPLKTALLPNFPNSFNPDTWIPYQLHQDAAVTLSIYDINGRLIRRFQLGHQPSGYYLDKSKAVHWDGKNQNGEPVASGIYWYVLQAGNFVERRNMLLTK
jgi:hypothetical protein